MTYPAPLSRLLVHVFQNGNTYLAVSNEAQGAGHLVETLAPRGPP